MMQQPREWHRQAGDQTFTISTSPNLLSHPFIHAAFASPAAFWAKPVSPEVLDTMISTSLFFGLYLQDPAASNPTADPTPTTTTNTTSPRLQQIGMARLVTDYATTAFLTDVYVAPEHQGKGLAKWLLRCVKECTDALPAPRRALMLMARNEGRATRFYADALGVGVHDQAGAGVVFMSSGVAGLDDGAAGV